MIRKPGDDTYALGDDALKLVRKAHIWLGLAMGLASCAAWNAPINLPQVGSEPAEELPFGGATGKRDDLFIGLAFSGGGTRASSFSYGMLKALQQATASPSNPDGLLNHVRLVTGVSGGSVTAAYYGLHGPDGMDVYREKYLIQNAEKYMATTLWNPITIAKGLSGGANSRKTFARFLDESILGKATFRDLWARGHVTTWINASDVANNTPFLFSKNPLTRCAPTWRICQSAKRSQHLRLSHWCSARFRSRHMKMGAIIQSRTG